MAFVKVHKGMPSVQFFIDVPECWGISADGSMMEVFNKFQMTETAS